MATRWSHLAGKRQGTDGGDPPVPGYCRGVSGTHLPRPPRLRRSGRQAIPTPAASGVGTGGPARTGGAVGSHPGSQSAWTPQTAQFRWSSPVTLFRGRHWGAPVLLHLDPAHRPQWTKARSLRKHEQATDLRVCRITALSFGVELRGLEPLTPTLPVWCATSCATAP